MLHDCKQPQCRCMGNYLSNVKLFRVGFVTVYFCAEYLVEGSHYFSERYRSPKRVHACFELTCSMITARYLNRIFIVFLP